VSPSSTNPQAILPSVAIVPSDDPGAGRAGMATVRGTPAGTSAATVVVASTVWSGGLAVQQARSTLSTASDRSQRGRGDTIGGTVRCRFLSCKASTLADDAP
jgi:hypothetical protein